MNDLTKIFKVLDYPKHTDKVYAALSDGSESFLVTEIAKQCGISRMVVYRCLEKLLANKLVGRHTTGKRTYYFAGSPHLLGKAVKIADMQTEKAVAPLIQKREKDVPQDVRFLYGADGIRAAFDDVISHSKRGETFFRYTSEKDLEKVNTYLAPDYRERRDSKKLERMVISNAISGQQKKSRLERFIRFIPSDVEQFEQNIIQLIYGDRVSLIDLTKEEVTIIENKQLADFQKSLFRVLYKRLDR